MGLLGEIFSASDSLKRRVKGLLSDPIGYLQQLDDQAKNYNNNVRPVISGGLLDNRPLTEKEKQQQAMELVMNVAPIGMTVWHGSPHKFTKFDMSKIGTGEGAQAYGHGLYTAELPEVAQQYQQFGSWQHRANGQAQPVMFKDAPVQFDKMGNVVGDHPKGLKMFLSRVASKGDYDAALNEVKQTLSDMKAAGSFPSIQDDLAEEIAQATANKSRIKASGAQGNLYKVDIPDEAVARMLDWDKPLSQQAPGVVDAVGRSGLKFGSDPKWRMTLDELRSLWGANADKLPEMRLTGQRLYTDFGGGMDVAERLRKAGIPGIRYLDGGSRSAGQGSSNFVLFDDQLPRIMEINGQATGTAPWKPGEWRGLLSP